MKKILYLILLGVMWGGGSLHAQELMELKRVELDSLVHFLRKEFQPDIYYIKDAAEQSTFSVSAPRPQFLEAAFDALREKGYVVSSYGSARFILRSKSVFSSLPAGYFDDGQSHMDDSGLKQYLAEQSAVVTFQNKVYEIGEPGAKHSGKAYVSGHVRDIASGEPLTGVSVYDDRTGAYTVTDGAGFYRIPLPVGDNQLNLSGYSLDDMHLTLKVWDDGVLDVVMKEKVLALTGAVISADAVSHHRDAKMGIERVRMEVINKIPTAFGEGDVLKAVLTLPGVKSVGEASSGFNVRGGSTDQNLILFNDGTIYNPTHLFGLFSAFNPEVISEVELYKSSIPAEYGGRISSVLDVRGREGNANKIAGSLGIGLLTSRFHLEGPIAKGRTTFILGGRTTYSNWLLNLLPKNSEYAGARAYFGDINASVTHKIDDNNTLHAYAYFSHDSFGFSRDTTFRYSNLNASLKWRSRLSSRLNLTAVAGYDQYGAQLDNTLGQNQLSGYRVSTRIQQGFAKATFRYALGEAHNLTYGGQATWYHLMPGAMSPLYENSLVKERELDPQDALEPALFASDSWTISPDFTVDAGIRLNGLVAMHPAKVYLNPEFRLSGKYSFRDNLSLKAGFNTLLDLHAGVHQGEAAAADGGHGRRAVGLEDIGNDAHGVRILGSEGHDRLEGAHRQVAVADLATAGTALRLGLARGERREVVVEHELLVILDEDLVHLLHIHLGAEGHGREGLGLTAGEDGGTVGAGEVIHLAPDRADLVADTAVQADALVKDHVAHGFLLLGVVVALHERGLLLEFLLGNRGKEFLLDGLEAFLTLLLGLGGLGKGVALVIAEVVHGLLQLLVLEVVRIVALVHVRAELVHELLLHAAVLLDLLVGELDGLEHVVLGHLVHLALDHHDVLLGGGDHQFEVGVLHLGEVRVDDEFTANAAHAHLGNRTAERQVGGGKGAGGGQAGEGIRLDVLLGGDQTDVYENFQVEIIRPQRADGTVHQAGDEHLVVGGLALALQEAAGETPCGIVLLTVVHGEGHEIGAFLYFFGTGHGGEDHRSSHLDNGGAGGLLGQFAGLDLDHAAVREFDCFLDYVHYCFSIASLYVFFIKKGMVPPGNHPSFFLSRLSTETELLDDLTVSLNVHRLEVIQDLAALTDEAEKGTTGDHVLLVLLHVLGKVSDTATPPGGRPS